MIVAQKYKIGILRLFNGLEKGILSFDTHIFGVVDDEKLELSLTRLGVGILDDVTCLVHLERVFVNIEKVRVRPCLYFYTLITGAAADTCNTEKFNCSFKCRLLAAFLRAAFDNG